MLFGRKKSRPAEIARGMREQALSLTAADLNLQPIEQDLGQNRHKLSPVFHAGHAVITQMRLVSEKKAAK